MLIGLGEDTSRSEKLLNEQIVGRTVDGVVSDARDWRSEHGTGVAAIIGRFRGNPELQPLVDQVSALRAMVNSADITPEGRDRLLASVDKAQSYLKPGDIQIYIAGAALLVAARAISSAASAVAAEQAKKRLAGTRFGKKIGVKRRRDDEE